MDLEHPFPGGLQHFRPPCCPRSDCPSRAPAGPPFLFRSRGRFVRLCDRRSVRRFHCHACRRSFSVQTFRVDYRLHRPDITHLVFDAFVSKMTQRQAARTIGCTRHTVRRRLLLLATHTAEFQARALQRAASRGALQDTFQLDELETFERDRRLRPVTLPVLIHKRSRFIVHVESAALPSRGGLRPRDLARKLEMERVEGVRRSGSRAAVKRCFERLAEALGSGACPLIETDSKPSYATVLADVLPKGKYMHRKHSGKLARTVRNPLWPINHTLAMLRDGLSRLVQRTWGVSKERAWLAHHAWVWIAYRNYIRALTNQEKRVTSAQHAGVIARRFTKWTFFEWRVAASA